MFNTCLQDLPSISARSGSCNSVPPFFCSGCLICVFKVGLRGIEELCTADVSEAVAWAEERGYPVIVKPPMSGGTDGL